MKRKLTFDSGIISGDDMRAIQEVFPETLESFKQRKSFDEYYYDDTDVTVTLDRIQALNNVWYHPIIGSDEIKIEL